MKQLTIESLEVESFSTMRDREEPGTAREFCPTICLTQHHTDCTCRATP